VNYALRRTKIHANVKTSVLGLAAENLTSDQTRTHNTSSEQLRGGSL